MSPDEAGQLRHYAEQGIERLYESLGGMLQRTLTNRFHVPTQDAEKLVYEVFAVYVTLGETVKDPEGWLIAATCESGVAWQRRHAMTPSPEADTEELRKLRKLLVLPEALAALPEPVREMVRLRFAEKRTYEEIAAEMDVPAFYAKVAVKKAMATLRKIARSRAK